MRQSRLRQAVDLVELLALVAELRGVRLRQPSRPRAEFSSASTTAPPWIHSFSSARSHRVHAQLALQLERGSGRSSALHTRSSSSGSG
jgi:hypothetical protein